MASTDSTEYPKDHFALAFIEGFNDGLPELKELAEGEDWEFFKSNARLFGDNRDDSLLLHLTCSNGSGHCLIQHVPMVCHLYRRCR